MHATICDYIADLVQNSVEADASLITLEISTLPEKIEVAVSDNGKGMNSETLRSAVDPFFTETGKHDHRRVGLGLALLKQTAEAVNGSMKITSQPEHGTEVGFSFDRRHLDTPPLGDIALTLTGLLTFEGDYELRVIRKSLKDEYTISRSELIETLGSLEQITNIALTGDFIKAQEENLLQ